MKQLNWYMKVPTVDLTKVVIKLWTAVDLATHICELWHFSCFYDAKKLFLTITKGTGNFDSVGLGQYWTYFITLVLFWSTLNCLVHISTPLPSSEHIWVHVLKPLWHLLWYKIWAKIALTGYKCRCTFYSTKCMWHVHVSYGFRPYVHIL